MILNFNVYHIFAEDLWCGILAVLCYMLSSVTLLSVKPSMFQEDSRREELNVDGDHQDRHSAW
jgi:hypothetical protein